MDLFFDTTESGMGAGATSVTALTDRIYGLLKIEPDGHAPPICSFSSGTSEVPGPRISPEARMGNQRRSSSSSASSRASSRNSPCSVQPRGAAGCDPFTSRFCEYKTLQDQQLKQLNLNSPDRTQSHVVQAGETLAAIAARHYRRPAEGGG